MHYTYNQMVKLNNITTVGSEHYTTVRNKTVTNTPVVLLQVSRHMVVCCAAQEAGMPHP